MNTPSLSQLGDIFPYFQFANAAGAFLRRASTLDISVQLAERRVVEVVVKPISRRAGLTFTENDFQIVLNDTLAPEDQPEEVGHEIAHTFHHNLTYSPPKNILAETYRDEVEKFCQLFAKLWVVSNGHAKIMDWLQNRTHTLA